MKALGRVALGLIALGLLPSAMTLIGHTLSLLRNCQNMSLEGGGDCPLETTLMFSWLLNIFAWPILGVGVCLGLVWLWKRR